MMNEEYIEISKTEIIQHLLVKLLSEFHGLCEDNGLIYNIFGGTMLGAVRHQGMIPWDDDIDVTMPRPDYERFIQIVETSHSDRFHLYSYPQKNYSYPFAKFSYRDSLLIENYKKKYSQLGLYIDVFPVDGYPSKDEQRYFQRLTKLKHIRCIAVNKPLKRQGLFGIIEYSAKKLRTTLCELPGVGFYINREIKLARSNDYEQSEYVLLQGAGWNQKGKLKKEIYLDRVMYPFDGIYVWGIRKYHEHLTTLYGDYMKMPPKEKRQSDHDYRLYIDKSLYKELR